MTDLELANHNFNKQHQEFQRAIRFGDIGKIKTLLFEGCDVSWNQVSSLHSAVRTGRSEIVKLLIQAGLDVICKRGEVLKLSFVDRYPSMFKLLLENGANVDFIDDVDVSCLEHFLSYEGTDDEEELEELGFDSPDDYQDECYAAHNCLNILRKAKAKHEIK